MLNKNLTVVTCGKENLKDVKITLNSMRKFQNELPKIILILSNFKDSEIAELRQEFSQLQFTIHCIPAEGVYKAMNHALGHIQQGHVLFLNSGDLIASESALEALVSSCYPNRWGYGPAIISNEELTSQKVYRFRPYLRLLHLAGLKYIPHSSSIVPIELLRKCGQFDLRYQVAADQKLLLQCSLVSEPIIFQNPISIFRLGGLSTRSPKEIVKDFKSISKELLPYWHFYNWPLLNPWPLILLVRILKRFSLREILNKRRGPKIN